MIGNDCIDTTIAEKNIRRPSITWTALFKAATGLFVDDCRRLGDQLVFWQRRASSRHQLRDMDSRLLRDMGIGRIDADREAAKPFWRA